MKDVWRSVNNATVFGRASVENVVVSWKLEHCGNRETVPMRNLAGRPLLMNTLSNPILGLMIKQLNIYYASLNRNSHRLPRCRSLGR